MKYELEQLEGMDDHRVNIEVSKLTNDEGDGLLIKFGTIINEHTGREVNYCNSWADMGPLIHEAKISLSPCYSADPVVYSYSPTGKWCAEHFYLQSGQVTNTNPLRAAAIVYILIKQEDY